MDIANPQSPTFRGGGHSSLLMAGMLTLALPWLGEGMHLHRGPTWYPLDRVRQIWADEDLTAGQRHS
eukprot:6482527-Amphidinium_carterae.1